MLAKMGLFIVPRLLVGAVLSCSVLALVSCSQTSSQGTEFYGNYSSAKQAIENGRLPEFLPPSATNIHLKFNVENNNILISFQFDPTNLPALLEKTDTVSPSRFREITPGGGVYRNENWFRKEIVQGNVDKLARDGFGVYEIGKDQIDRIVTNRVVKWFLVIHPSKAVAYAWN